MKWHLEDKAIGDLFKQLREEEERAIPSFREVLRGNEAPGGLEIFAHLRQAAAVAMVLVLLLSSQEELMSTVPVLELPDFATGQIEFR
jgi:hypothetical protein